MTNLETVAAVRMTVPLEGRALLLPCGSSNQGVYVSAVPLPTGKGVVAVLVIGLRSPKRRPVRRGVSKGEEDSRRTYKDWAWRAHMKL
jgi:hypothetical protein